MTTATPLPLMLCRDSTLLAWWGLGHAPVRIGHGATADWCLPGEGPDLVAIATRDGAGHPTLMRMCPPPGEPALTPLDDRALALGDGMSVAIASPAQQATHEDGLRRRLEALPVVPPREDGQECLEITRWWGDVRVETHHLPLDTPVTLGEGTVARWRLLGVDVGDVPEPIAPVLRVSPPLASEVTTEAAHDLVIPAHALPGGRPWTLVVPGPTGPRVSLPPGCPLVATTPGALGPNDQVAIDLGGTVLVVRRRPAVDRVASAPLTADGPFIRALGVAASLTAILGGVSAVVPRATTVVVTLPEAMDRIVRHQVVRPPPPPEAPKVADTAPNAVAKGSGRRGASGAAAPGPDVPPPPIGAVMSDLFGLLDAGPAIGAAWDTTHTTPSAPRGTVPGGHGLGERGPGLSDGGDAASLGWGDGDDGPLGGGVGDRPIGLGSPKPASMGPDPDRPAITVGALTRDEVDRVMRRNMQMFRHCYQRGLQSDPTLGGGLSIRFGIGGDGHVLQAAVGADTLADPRVGQCVRERVLRLRFPEPRGGGRVQVTYPFVFAPG